MAFFIESVVFFTLAFTVFVMMLDRVWNRIIPGGTAMVKECESSESVANLKKGT